MTVAAPLAGRRWHKPPLIRNPALRWGLMLGAGIYLVLASWSILADVNWLRVYEGLPRGAKFIGGFFPPFPFSTVLAEGSWAELAAQRMIDISDGLMESLTMTVTATVVGILISVPIGLGAARNIAPLPVYLLCRGIVGISRTFQEVIIAIYCVAIFGFGPFAGLVTLSFATIGFLGKLLAEDIESMDPGQAEAVRATGSRWLQWINYGVQPQVMPRLIGLSLYRLDINFRESSVVGIVGAGGIGATLNTAFDRYEYDTAAAILLIIIGVVFVAEYTSSKIRQWVQYRYQFNAATVVLTVLGSLLVGGYLYSTYDTVIGWMARGYEFDAKTAVLATAILCAVLVVRYAVERIRARAG